MFGTSKSIGKLKVQADELLLLLDLLTSSPVCDFIDLGKELPELFSSDHTVTLGTDIIIFFEPTQRLLDLVAAARADETESFSSKQV